MILMRVPKKYDASRGTLGGYLYGIARNRVMKHLERLPREVFFGAKKRGWERRGMFCRSDDSSKLGGNARTNGQVRAAVLELPAEFREAVVLCELEELSYEEAAQRPDARSERFDRGCIAGAPCCWRN